jgi:hypothetical protein
LAFPVIVEALSVYVVSDVWLRLDSVALDLHCGRGAVHIGTNEGEGVSMDTNSNEVDLKGASDDRT